MDVDPFGAVASCHVDQKNRTAFGAASAIDDSSITSDVIAEYKLESFNYVRKRRRREEVHPHNHCNHTSDCCLLFCMVGTWYLYLYCTVQIQKDGWMVVLVLVLVRVTPY